MFDKQKSMIRVQGGRQYLPVAARLVWFRQEHPGWGIETTMVQIDHERQFAIFRAVITDDDGRTIATATKKEDVKGFGDFIEKSETGAIGRALGLCGFGTDNDPDFDDGRKDSGDEPHIVDSPQRSHVTPSARFTDSRQAYAPRPSAPPRQATANIEDDPFSND